MPLPQQPLHASNPSRKSWASYPFHNPWWNIGQPKLIQAMGRPLQQVHGGRASVKCRSAGDIFLLYISHPLALRASRLSVLGLTFKSFQRDNQSQISDAGHRLQHLWTGQQQYRKDCGGLQLQKSWRQIIASLHTHRSKLQFKCREKVKIYLNK